jgi:HlyD family secretion protein
VIAQNLSDMQVEASVDESDVGRIRVGQTATFNVDAFPGQNFEGEVRQVRKAAVNVANVVTYVAVVGFSNASGRLLPGMTANVRIQTDALADVLKVPNAALRMRIPGVEVVTASEPKATAPLDAASPPPAMRKQGKAGTGVAPVEAAVPRATTRGRIYLVDTAGQPKAYNVRLGITDGSFTEVVADASAPGAELLQEGAAVIVGLPLAGSARPAVKLPF